MEGYLVKKKKERKTKLDSFYRIYVCVSGNWNGAGE